MAARMSLDTNFEPQQLARLAGLRYVSDADRGFARQRNGNGFIYLSALSKRLRDKRQLDRIEHLAIPPAWTQVWICRFANGHLQATGHDDRKRKQYLYHQRWRAVADAAKFVHLERFGRSLPDLRRKVAGDLRGTQLSRQRVLAGMVWLLDATSIRIGNEEYVRANNSYGLATLRSRHVTSKSGRVELRFRAKGGQPRQVIVDDKRLVRLLRQLKRLPGARLFQYRDGSGKLCAVNAADVNSYLSERTGFDITAKDFRTWKASALAAGKLLGNVDVENTSNRKRLLKEIIADVAATLGNTPAVCRKSYIHAGLLEGFQADGLREDFRGYRPGRRSRMSREETLFLHFLKHWRPGIQSLAASGATA